MNKLKDIIDNIDILKKKLDEKRPLSADITKSLKIYYNAKIIFNSIYGKGNTFTNQEIEAVLSSGSTICGKNDNEYTEITDYVKALDYIEKLSKERTTELNELKIINIHSILFKNTVPEIAGKYRNSPSWISLENEDKDTTVCDHLLIQDEMNNYFNWLFDKRNEHPVIISAEAHNKFVEIHPFCDGNGRTGRLIMNLILLNYGYVPIIIYNYKYKRNYYDSIKSWRHGKKDDFYNFIADCERKSLECYLSKIESLS
jgi:Fic family protein